MNEIRKLVDELNRYRSAYYNQNKSLISDREYDALYDKLEQMEKSTGIIYADSPTQSVGYEVISKLNKVKHNHLLLSLAKTTDIKEFADYFKGHTLCLMGKMDGLTVSLHYVGGKLVSAESRGNGEIGEDITHNARMFANLPLEIPFEGDLIVDGECIIDRKTFDEINEREHTEYKHPRNLVSGTVRQLNSEIVKNRKVRFIAWKLYSLKDGAGNHIYDNFYSTGFKALSDFGFEIVPATYISEFNYDFGNNIDDNYNKLVDSKIKELKSYCDKMNYPIDGIVGTFDDVKYGEFLGSTGHHPKHSLAFKFYQEGNETVLRDIEWSTSRTGVVNPVAVFDPVEIDGTTVTRATLNNVSVIKELELGIGDTITIIKANEIIPQIRENLTMSNTYVLPTVCPACHKELVVRNETGREFLYCTNKSCPAITHDKIANFASREGMNIVGISDERLKILMDNGYIGSFTDIYYLHENKNELDKLDGFGKSSVKNLLDAIEESKNCKFANVLVAIGIPGIGKSAAKIISKYCEVSRNREDIFKFFMELACDNHDWTEITGFGAATSDAINKYIQNNYNDIIPLVDILNIAENGEREPESNMLEAKTFCISGKLYYYENRDKLIGDIERYGGRVVSAVNSKTDYLITNEPDNGSNKNRNAKKYGTEILSERDFMRMCGLIK